MSLIWRAAAPLILASGSATRRRLLEAAGLPFEVISPQVDERAIETHLGAATPADLAAALAREKALAVSTLHPDAYVIGADQVLSCAGEALHKSRNRVEAMRTLTSLSGRAHLLTSAFAIARRGEIVAADLEAANLTMRALDAAALNRYLDAAGEAVLASVGVYQWEGLGAHLFASVEGDQSTILGLPMLKLLAALRSQAALAF